MALDHFDRFFTLAAVGLGLFLTGGLNVLLGRSGRRPVLRLLGTIAVCAVVTAVFASLSRPEPAIASAQILAGVLLCVALSGSLWFGQRLTALTDALRRPGPRWGLVAMCGLSVLLSAGVAFDRADEATTDAEIKRLEMVSGHPAVQPNDEFHAATDRGTRIVLKEAIAPRPTAELLESEEKILRECPFADQMIRRAGPTNHSNCHGWVFANGRFLLSPDDVETVLTENGYHPTHAPHPGDLAIYRRDGKIIHSAVVRYVTPSLPVLVEAKWGVMGVFLHPADQSFYGTDYTFYRSDRPGHTLTGVDGDPAPDSTAGTHAAAE